jgi:hypothetical protein
MHDDIEDQTSGFTLLGLRIAGYSRPMPLFILKITRERLTCHTWILKTAAQTGWDWRFMTTQAAST